MVKITKNGVLELFWVILLLDFTDIGVNKNNNIDVTWCKMYISNKILVPKSLFESVFAGRWSPKRLASESTNFGLMMVAVIKYSSDWLIYKWAGNVFPQTTK